MASMIRLSGTDMDVADVVVSDGTTQWDTGIECEYGPQRVVDCDITSFTYGIYIDGNLAWVEARGNRILSCATAVYAFNAVSVSITDNWLAGYTTQGILDTTSALYNRYVGNYLERTAGADYGMRIYGDSNVITSNVVRYTHDVVDFDIQGDGNTVVGNKGYDLDVSGNENIITGNYLTSDVEVVSGALSNIVGPNWLIDINDAGTGTYIIGPGAYTPTGTGYVVPDAYTATFSVPSPSASTGTTRIYPPWPAKVIDARATISSLTPSTSEFIIDVNAAGATLFKSTSRPTISTGSYDSGWTIANATGNALYVTSTEYLTADVDAAGTGTNMLVHVRMRPVTS